MALSSPENKRGRQRRSNAILRKRPRFEPLLLSSESRAKDNESLVLFSPFDERISRVALAGFGSVETDIADASRVVETTETDSPPIKRLVDRSHDGLLHVVDEYLDLSG